MSTTKEAARERPERPRREFKFEVRVTKVERPRPEAVAAFWRFAESVNGRLGGGSE